MAYWIHETGNKNSWLWRFFMCDYISDISKLPTATTKGEPQLNDTVCKDICAPGSKCLCLEDGSTWFLGKETNTWTCWKNASTGNTSNIEPIPDSQIESLFS